MDRVRLTACKKLSPVKVWDRYCVGWVSGGQPGEYWEYVVPPELVSAAMEQGARRES